MTVWVAPASDQYYYPELFTSRKEPPDSATRQQGPRGGASAWTVCFKFKKHLYFISGARSLSGLACSFNVVECPETETSLLLRIKEQTPLI